MRILQGHKFFYRRGGAEVIFLDTIAGLRSRGHEVVEFSSEHKSNLPSEYSSYFAKNIGELSERQGITQSFKVFRHLFCSKDVEQKLQALILATNPEVAHLHNVYHQLSASTFKVLKKNKIPILMTVHDVQAMCPNHRMVRGRDNKLCEACSGHNYFNAIRYRCINNSTLASAAGAVESYYYYLRGIWNMVDRFVIPSEFMFNKMIQYGFPKNKMRLVRNPFPLTEEIPPLGDKIVYMGRFHVEKGIRTLMQALPVLRQFKTVVAGSGPDNAWVDNFIRQSSLTNVERLNWVDRENWLRVMKQSCVIVVPSLFYENCSVAVLEALSYGRIVVATDRGGNRELIKDGVTGFLVEPENPEALASAIKMAMNLPEIETKKIIHQARELVDQNHKPSDYLDSLEALYKEVV